MRRQAKIRLYPERIMEFLDLSDGYRFVHLYAMYDPFQIVVVVEADHLEEQPDDVELPYLDGSLFREILRDDSGRTFLRWGWTPS